MRVTFKTLEQNAIRKHLESMKQQVTKRVPPDRDSDCGFRQRSSPVTLPAVVVAVTGSASVHSVSVACFALHIASEVWVIQSVDGGSLVGELADENVLIKILWRGRNNWKAIE